MSGQTNKYDDDFKKSIVNLYHSGKSQTQLSKEYGISLSAISKWIKLFSEVKLDNDTILTANQIKDLQKRNAMLKEENLILKKRLPYSLLTPPKIKCCTYP
uniref:transposase n=1 Tax=Enterocloster clostridioformis TaxID=1531 RepID=UPI002674C3D4|nr:transposase [Enterocloster clostridioformis]